MALSNRPTLSALISRIADDIIARTETDDAALRETVENVLAEVFAGIAHGLYGEINTVSRQGPPIAESEFETILGWAQIFLRTPFVYGEASEGEATFTGIDTTLIPAGTQIVNRDGWTYETDADGTITGGEIVIAITAVEPGEDGDAEAGTTFSLVSPISGVDSSGEYEASGGSDDETKEELFERLVNRLSEPFRGGGPGDFENWALEANGSVANAWEFAREPETGWVTVVIATANLGTPSGALITEVEEYIEEQSTILKTGIVVRAPDYQTLSLTIQDALSAQQSNIEAAILAYLRSELEPGDTIDITLLENEAQQFDSDCTITSPVGTADPGEFGMYNAVSITWTGDT